MSEPEMENKPFRVLPAVDDTTAHFWHGGEDNELRFLRCDSCAHFLHPPAPICPECLGRELAPAAVSGLGRVHTFTINHQPWYPTLDPPYVIAIVELDEQPALRLTTNIFNCAPDDVTIGMAVRVVFEQYDDVWLPMFEPVDDDLRRAGAHLAAAAPGGDDV